jgi:hypothetical protein
MFSNDDFQTPKGKARKGLASVSVANGYLRIRIRIGRSYTSAKEQRRLPISFR